MTRLQLRRLALQATRRPELLPVLQDALLESPVYGDAFERAIERAHADASTTPAHVDSLDVARLNPIAVGVFFSPMSRAPFLHAYLVKRDYDLTSPRSLFRIFHRIQRPLVYQIPVRPSASWRRK